MSNGATLASKGQTTIPKENQDGLSMLLEQLLS